MLHDMHACMLASYTVHVFYIATCMQHSTSTIHALYMHTTSSHHTCLANMHVHVMQHACYMNHISSGRITVVVKTGPRPIMPGISLSTMARSLKAALCQHS